MDETVLKFRVGVFVLFSILILGVLIFLHIDGFQSQYTVYVKPGSAPGVTRNTPVRKNGLLIGRVARVETEDAGVSVVLRINSDEKIYENEQVTFGTESFLGDAVVEIIAPKEVALRGPLVGDQALLENVFVKPNPMEVVQAALNLEPQLADTLAIFAEAGESVKDASDRISEVSELVQFAFQDEESEFKQLLTDIRNFAERADGAFSSIERTFNNLSEITEDPELRGKFDEFLDSSTGVLDELRVTVESTRETINSFRDVSDRAVANLDNLEPITSQLKEDGPEIVRRVRDGLGRIDGLVEEVGQFTESLGKLGESEGTLGRLINDRELYDELLTTLNNVRRVSEKLEPVMNDVRTLTDSLARDPGQLGLRGSFDKRPTGTGYKASSSRGELFRNPLGR